MTTFDKFRNCITEPRCRDCEGIPGVCEEEHQSVSIPKALALDVLNELKEQEALNPTDRGNGFGKLFHCSNCGQRFTDQEARMKVKYCHECGRAVKWE